MEYVATPKPDPRWYRKIPDNVINRQEEQFNANIEDPKEVAHVRQSPINATGDPLV